jgi:hypothetical protein
VSPLPSAIDLAYPSQLEKPQAPQLAPGRIPLISSSLVSTSTAKNFAVINIISPRASAIAPPTATGSQIALVSIAAKTGKKSGMPGKFPHKESAVRFKNDDIINYPPVS